MALTQVQGGMIGTVNGLTDSSGSVYGGLYGFKNRIINGAMMIDQRNNGASINLLGSHYNIDRWNTQQAAQNIATQRNAGSITPPAGFTNYLGFTVALATTPTSSNIFQTQQLIEGFNIADLGWGTANAQPVTISFWVRSSLTGAFSGSLSNDSNARSYPYTFVINSANTWEYKTVTIAGDTSGTWRTDNGAGIKVGFSLGMGSTYTGTANTWQAGTFLSATGTTNLVATAGATFYITGVQLEKGSTATSFDYRPYGTELALCQRYYYRVKANSSASQFGSGFNFSNAGAVGYTTFPVTMRSSPTGLEQSGTASDYGIYRAGDTIACTSVPSFNTCDQWAATTLFTTTAGQLTAGQGTIVRAFTTGNGFLGWSAEL